MLCLDKPDSAEDPSDALSVTAAASSDALHCTQSSLTKWQAAAAATVLLTGYAILNACFVAQLGVRISRDGALYIKGADALLHGLPLQELLKSRIGYISLIAVFQQIGLGLPGVVAFQMLIAGLATIALYGLGRQLGGPWVGVGAAALFALNPDFVHWNCYILTDSLYISMVILATWAIYWAPRGTTSKSLKYVLAVAILSVAALMRPNGWLLVLIAACYWFASLNLSASSRWAGLTLAAGTFVIGSFLLLSFRPGLLTNSPDAMLRQGEVIWGHKASRLDMPQDEAEEGGLPGAAGYALRHPLACARLAAFRVFTELAHVRPYYSARHNVVRVLEVLPIYVLALVGFLTWRRHRLTRLLAITIAAHLMIQAINYADWSGRFLLYVFPLFGVLAAAGFIVVLAKFIPSSRLSR